MRHETRRIDGSGSHEAAESGGIGMLFMRAWLWLVPAAMLVVSVIFATIAALDGSWVLVAVMALLGVLALALFAVHWWVMYRFGSTRP